MSKYLIRRILSMIPTLFVISMLVFVIIQLPPGDVVDARIAELRVQGGDISQERIEDLREQFHLNDPMYVRYFKWIGGIILQGDFGYSLMEERSVNKLIWERIGYSVILALSSILFTWVVAFPIGIFTAVKQYSIWDYFFTILAFVGMATPNFVLALVLMYLGHAWFGVSVGGLFSLEYMDAPWSWQKFVDLLVHIWIPMIVVGTAGTAGLVRILRANLLDELRKPYVQTARSKGVHIVKVIFKYPVRIAINPFISTVGWILPRIFSGAAIVSIVLSLPTIGPLLLNSLRNQDMYLAGSFLLIISTLTVIGTLLSDILLAIVDPRIRYE